MIPALPFQAARCSVEIPNAFIGKAAKPSADELDSALGSSATVWEQFVDWIAKEHAITVQEWKCYSAKFGWSLRLKLKKRTIVYLSPCDGCFRVLFILGDRAIEATNQIDLPPDVVAAISQAPKYPEGTGIRLMVNRASDLIAIRKLVAIKLAH
jgi:hypothetical protein